MPALLDVDSDLIAAVGRAFLAANDAVCDIVADASQAANGGAGMAGVDSTGAAWASDYDDAAWALLRASATVVDALGILGDRLVVTGENHDAADTSSTQGAPAYPGSGGSGSRAVGIVVSPPPTADGTPTDPPAGWSLIAHLIAWVWPAGHPDQLWAVAAGWLGASLQLTDAADALSGPISDLAGQQSPEVPYAVEVCRGLQSAVRLLAEQHSIVSQVCSGYASAIEGMHADVENELVGLGVAEGVIELFGALASIPSGGTAQVPTQSMAAARFTVAAARVARILTRLAEEVATLDNLIQAVNERLVNLLVELQTITAQRDTLQAVTELLDAGVPPVDLQANEDNNPTAHVIEKHVAKSDEYLISRRIPVASTFTSLATAMVAISALLAASRQTIAAWLAGSDPDKVLVGPLPVGAGRSFIRKTKQFVVSTRVRVVLKRTANGGYYIETAFPEP